MRHGRIAPGLADDRAGPIWPVPSDCLLEEVIAGGTWRLTYEWDNGSTWGFAVEGPDGTRSEASWNYSIRAYPARPDAGTPERVRSVLDKAVNEASPNELAPEELALLELAVTSVDAKGSVSGKRLRHGLVLADKDEFYRLVRRLVPRFVEIRNAADADDRYALTFAGLLRTRIRPQVEGFVERILAFFRDQYKGDPDFSRFSVSEAMSATRIESPDIFEAFLHAAQLGWVDPGRDPRGRPYNDIEDLVRLQKFRDFVEHGRKGARPGLAPNAFFFRPEPPARTPIVAPFPTRGKSTAKHPDPPKAGALGTAGVYRTALAEYRRIEQIGQGGSGLVEKVRREDGRHFALKRLDPNGLSAKRQKRFRNEMSFVARSNHPHVLRLVDYGLFEGGKGPLPFFVMPLYPRTLGQAIAANLEREKIPGIVRQLLEGLGYAHEQKVWHRDIKPENIALDDDGRVVILDFGIAHFAAELLFTQVETHPGERLANFLYAAPEQRQRGAVVDGRADIFAVGKLLNQMFTGIVPDGTGFRQIGEVDAAYAELDALVDRMIQHDPDRRPANVEEVLSALDSCSLARPSEALG